MVFTDTLNQVYNKKLEEQAGGKYEKKIAFGPGKEVSACLRLRTRTTKATTSSQADI